MPQPEQWMADHHVDEIAFFLVLLSAVAVYVIGAVLLVARIV